MSDQAHDLRVTRRVALTNTAIEAMAIGAELKDDRVPGLSVRRNAGGRSFLLYYRARGSGAQRRPKIGDCAVLTLAQAREIARNMLARVAAGEDPSAERGAARAAPTMDDLWERCEREHWNKGKAWDREAARLWATYLRPKLGGRRVAEVSYDDVWRVHDKLKATPVTANRTLAVASKMLSLAAKFGPENAKWRTAKNPCEDVTRFPERKRKRYAKPVEMAQVAALLEAEALAHPEQAAFVYLLIFSGARPSEIVNAGPEQIERREKDGVLYGVLRLRGKTSDATGEDRCVFLPPQAMAVLAKLPAEGVPLRRRDGSRGRRTITGLAGVPRALWKRVKPDGMWMRDWRRTFATVALSNGLAIGKVGELLGHASVQTTKIYAKLMDDEAHAAAAAVAGQMETLLRG